jgi:hypothetical protein
LNPLSHEIPTVEAKPKAVVIRFVEQLPAAVPALATFVHPQKAFAVAESAGVEQLLTLPSLSEHKSDRLRLLLLPAGLALPQELLRQAEDWMQRGGNPEGEPTIELLLRSERILWRPGQALMIGPPERLDEVLRGLIEFAFYEGELRRLEREVEADWSTLEADSHLTHSVTPAACERRRHIDEMTMMALQRRMRFARLEPCLEKASVSLPGPARRLAGELAMQAEVTERLGWLDDRLEVAEDLYELANDRLSEFTYFHREFRLELWIVVLLLAEVAIMAAELWWMVRHP